MNEYLFKNFLTNYNDEPAIYRKGTFMHKVFKFYLFWIEFHTFQFQIN